MKSVNWPKPGYNLFNNFKYFLNNCSLQKSDLIESVTVRGSMYTYVTCLGKKFQTKKMNWNERHVEDKISLLYYNIWAKHHMVSFDFYMDFC